MCDKGWVFELGEGEMGAGVKIGKMYRLFKLLQKMDQRILLLTRFNKMYIVCISTTFGSGDMTQVKAFGSRVRFLRFVDF